MCHVCQCVADALGSLDCSQQTHAVWAPGRVACLESGVPAEVQVSAVVAVAADHIPQHKRAARLLRHINPFLDVRPLPSCKFFHFQESLPTLNGSHSTREGRAHPEQNRRRIQIHNRSTPAALKPRHKSPARQGANMSRANNAMQAHPEFGGRRELERVREQQQVAAQHKDLLLD